MASTCKTNQGAPLLLDFFPCVVPTWGTADAEIKYPPLLLVGAQGYQRFPLALVGRNIALHAVPAYWDSTHLLSAFPAAHSTLVSPKFSNRHHRGMCIK